MFPFPFLSEVSGAAPLHVPDPGKGQKPCFRFLLPEDGHLSSLGRLSLKGHLESALGEG